MPARRPAPSLKARALALLAQREHSAIELRRKLLRQVRRELQASADVNPVAPAQSRGVDRSRPVPEIAATADSSEPAEAAEAPKASETADQRIEEVIAWLQANRYLSEERFVESRVHARAARYGNLRIRQELSQHQATLPAEVAQALRDSEFERAQAVWRRKFDSPPGSVAERARHARFLAQRGFSAEVIARVVRAENRAHRDDEEMDSAPPGDD